jgi:hypothetical protein
MVMLVKYQDGVLMIRFFGSHDEYDQIGKRQLIMSMVRSIDGRPIVAI